MGLLQGIEASEKLKARAQLTHMVLCCFSRRQDVPSLPCALHLHSATGNSSGYFSVLLEESNETICIGVLTSV